MRRSSPCNRLLQAGLALALGAFLAAPARAGVTLDIDAASLNEVLSALAAQEVEVALTEGRSLTVRLEQLKVLGFDPTAGPAQEGRIRTSVRVVAPDVGLAVTLQPALSLRIVDGATGELELRFEEVELPLPLVGPINLAPLLRPTRFPADYVWQLEGAAGPSWVRSRLVGVRMGRETLRFSFEVGVVAPPRAERAGQGS